MKKIILVIVSLMATLLGANAFATAFATATVGASSYTINQPVALNIAVSNAGSAFNITGLQITANYNGTPTTRPSFAVSQYNFGPNAPALAIGGANTVTNLSSSLVFFAPSSGVTGQGTGVYYIGGVVYGSDGSVTPITFAAKAKINPQAYVFPENQ